MKKHALFIIIHFIIFELNFEIITENESIERNRFSVALIAFMIQLKSTS